MKNFLVGVLTVSVAVAIMYGAGCLVGTQFPIPSNIQFQAAFIATLGFGAILITGIAVMFLCWVGGLMFQLGDAVSRYYFNLKICNLCSQIKRLSKK